MQMQIDNSFKDKLFDTLWAEYNSTNLLRENTTLFQYIKQDYIRQSEQYEIALSNAKNIKERKKLLASNGLPVASRLYIYHKQFNEAYKKSNHEAIFTAFSNIISLCAKDPAPRHFYNIKDLSNAGSDEAFEQLINVFLPFIMLGTRYEMIYVGIYNLKNRADLESQVREFYSLLTRIEAIPEQRDSFIDSLIEMCMVPISDYENAQINVVDRLCNTLFHNSICFHARYEFFNNNGYKIDKANHLYPIEAKQNKAKGRPAKIDKTMALIQNCYQALESDSNSIFQDIFSSTDNTMARFENGKNFFLDTIKKYRQTNEIYAREYENLFLPLFIDTFTGTSMCIIGKNHYQADYEQLKSIPYPCALAVLNFTDVSDRNAIVSIAYETFETFDYYITNQIEPEEYFNLIYQEYRIAVEKGHKTLLDINTLTILPSSSEYFHDFLAASQYSVAQMPSEEIDMQAFKTNKRAFEKYEKMTTEYSLFD